MQLYKILVLTDHTNHSSENSLYALVRAMRLHPRCSQVDVVTKGNPSNAFFFENCLDGALWAVEATEDFGFSSDGRCFHKKLRRVFLSDYDAVWLRMPPPLSQQFIQFLTQQYQHTLIFNAPDGIYQTGSKAFLLNFPDLCPPMKLCQSIDDIIDFKKQFPIVLKPFREYGGKGIVRIDGEGVWEGNQKITFTEFARQFKESNTEYLGVKFLKNVSEGDKRVVVVNGEIMGASLRLPPEDSWICNVSMGGQSHNAEVDEREREIIAKLDPVLSKMGIVIYGIDTLVGDDGNRVLSEINTTSIGGLPQMAKYTGRPLVEMAINLIWDYIIENMNKDQYDISN